MLLSTKADEEISYLLSSGLVWSDAPISAPMAES